MTPDACAVQVEPAAVLPVVVCQITPLLPTAQPLLASVKKTARMVGVVDGEVWAVHVVPPFSVRRITPAPPTAKPSCELTKKTP